MRANVSLVAPNLSDAREKARVAFEEFFGADQPFEVVEESAESHAAVETQSGEFRVVSWRCDFTAEGGDA